MDGGWLAVDGGWLAVDGTCSLWMGAVWRLMGLVGGGSGLFDCGLDWFVVKGSWLEVDGAVWLFGWGRLAVDGVGWQWMVVGWQ